MGRSLRQHLTSRHVCLSGAVGPVAQGRAAKAQYTASDRRSSMMTVILLLLKFEGYLMKGPATFMIVSSHGSQNRGP